MRGLTDENRKKLDGLVSEYAISLDRTRHEKDLQKAMEETAQAVLQLDPKHFKKLAIAIWKDQRQAVQEDIEAQLNLFLLFEPAESAENPGDEPARRNRSKPIAVYQSPGALQ